MVKIKELWIKKSNVLQLFDWIEENAPYEACALLLGKIKMNIAHVEEVLLTPNTSRSSVHFEIDPEFLLKVLLELEEKDQELVSIFHSHPAGAHPSGVDLDNMKFLDEFNPYGNFKPYKNLIWIIMDAQNKELNGFIYFKNEIMNTRKQRTMWIQR